jgi:hypothetical protein
MSATSLRMFILPLGIALTSGIIVETLLFRIFSRTGIYLFNQDTPSWVYEIYQITLWVGNLAYNFSTILVIVLLIVVGFYFWKRSKDCGRLFPVLITTAVVWNLTWYVWDPGPKVVIAYLVLSSMILWVSISRGWHSTSWVKRSFLFFVGLSFGLIYYFKAIPAFRQTGWSFSDYGITAFQIAEAVAGVAIIMAFIYWGRTRELRIIIPPILIAALIVVGFIFGPERYPLVSIWALGITMKLPFLAYIIGMVLLGVTILNLIRTHNEIPALALVLLFFGHRMLPLTYFNLLVLTGFALLYLDNLPKIYSEPQKIEMPYRNQNHLGGNDAI